ncbi:unnamed protein product, partial [Amoebophrya sp. A25]|eukprot:GSA25T00024530001.1
MRQAMAVAITRPTRSTTRAPTVCSVATRVAAVAVTLSHLGPQVYGVAVQSRRYVASRSRDTGGVGEKSIKAQNGGLEALDETGTVVQAAGASSSRQQALSPGLAGRAVLPNKSKSRQRVPELVLRRALQKAEAALAVEDAEQGSPTEAKTGSKKDAASIYLAAPGGLTTGVVTARAPGSINGETLGGSRTGDNMLSGTTGEPSFPVTAPTTKAPAVTAKAPATVNATSASVNATAPQATAVPV